MLSALRRLATGLAVGARQHGPGGDARGLAAMVLCGRGTVSCTLDFIEGRDGMVLPEGGPPHTPFGGGHPRGFAGLPRADRAALRVMPGITFADPRTWHETDRTVCIFSGEQADELAHGAACEPGGFP